MSQLINIKLSELSCLPENTSLKVSRAQITQIETILGISFEKEAPVKTEKKSKKDLDIQPVEAYDDHVAAKIDDDGEEFDLELDDDDDEIEEFEPKLTYTSLTE